MSSYQQNCPGCEIAKHMKNVEWIYKVTVTQGCSAVAKVVDI